MYFLLRMKTGQPVYLKIKTTMTKKVYLVFEFYFSLHFVKMFEYIKSYLKMSNGPDIKFHFIFKNHLV